MMYENETASTMANSVSVPANGFGCQAAIVEPWESAITVCKAPPVEERWWVAGGWAHRRGPGEDEPAEDVAQREGQDRRAYRKAQRDRDEADRVIGDRQVGGQPEPEQLAAVAVPLGN